MAALLREGVEDILFSYSIVQCCIHLIVYACQCTDVHAPYTKGGLTKHNSRFEKISLSHIRDQWLKPLFGVTVVDAHRSLASNLRVRVYSGKVQIGLWEYRCKANEDGRQVYRARASWFRIKAKHVPHYIENREELCDEEQPYNKDEMLYGRFMYFAEVHTTWNLGQALQPFIFGNCRLFRAISVPEESNSKWSVEQGLASIDINKPLAYTDDAKVRNPAYRGLPQTKEIEWVQLKHVEGMVALGPIYVDEGQSLSADSPKTSRWCVMELHV